MKRIFQILFWAAVMVSPFVLGAQTIVDPQTFPSDTTISDNDETYGRPGGTNKKFLMKYMRKYVRQGFNGVITVDAISGSVQFVNDQLAWTKLTQPVRDSIITGKKKVRLMATKPGASYLADMCVDTVGIDSIYFWNTSAYKLLQIVKTTNGYIEINENNVNAEAFEIRKRDIGLNIPVPTIRPKTTNKVVALDVMPNGYPVEYFDNGYAWIDVCSADVQNNSNPTYTARIGVRPNRVEFGEKKYGGGFKPLAWIFDTIAIHTYYEDGSWYLRPSKIYLQNPGTGTAVQGLGLDSNDKIVTTALGGGSGISALTNDISAAGSGSVPATINPNRVDSSHVKDAGLSLNDFAQFGATNGQVIAWNNTLGKWRPSNASGSGVTGSNNQTVRINSSGVAEATSVLTNDGTNLTSSGRITTNSLSVVNNATGATNGLIVRNQSVSGYSNIEFRDNTDALVGYWGYANPSVSPAILQGRLYIGAINKAFVITTDANSTGAIFVGTNSNVGFSNTSPTAKVHLPAGTASAGTAPFKFTSGTLMSTPEAGATEYDGNEFYLTNSGANRTIASRILKGSGTLDFGSTAANSVNTLTITVTGAVDGDVVSLGVPNGSQTTTGIFTAWVSAANTVSVKFYNGNILSAEDPASGTFKVTVTK